MKTYTIGRSKKANITINEEKTIGRIHVELSEEANGRYYIIDCNSTNGTFHQKHGQWLRIRQTYVNLDEPLLLGRYQTTVRQLLARQIEAPLATPQPYNGSVERHPETGEIIPRRD